MKDFSMERVYYVNHTDQTFRYCVRAVDSMLTLTYEEWVEDDSDVGGEWKQTGEGFSCIGDAAPMLCEAITAIAKQIHEEDMS